MGGGSLPTLANSTLALLCFSSADTVWPCLPIRKRTARSGTFTCITHTIRKPRQAAPAIRNEQQLRFDEKGS